MNPRHSLTSLPGRFFVEPQFATATLRLADAIADALIQAAEIARPAWTQLVGEFGPEIKRLTESEVQISGNLFRHPLVRLFTRAWITALNWPVVAVYGDGVQLQLPGYLVDELRATSAVMGMNFYLAALGEVCCARLGSNDHNCDYGLYLNVPIWIPLGVEPQFCGSFARQIRMVLHHEMGHFRWRGGSLRAEHIAHARGVAALRDGKWPSCPIALQAVLESEYPEAWHNEEIRSLVMETRGGARLIRAWGQRRSRLRTVQAVPP